MTTTKRESYGVVFAILVIFTALEVVFAYLIGLPLGIRIGLLIFLAVVKVVLVLLYFMHLRFDQRLFALPFGLGTVLAIPLALIIGLTTQPVTNANALNVAGNLVNVTLRSYKIDLSTDHVPSGMVTFHITNQATDMMHELIVIKTDLPPDQLPTDSLGRLLEDSVNIIDAHEDIFFGTTVNMQLNLDPGNYVLVCNLPEHYQAGMNVAFTVEGAVPTEATSEATAEATADATQ
ncbi:MAG: cytochrome C oxidase subunit IV family protein [Chloroflexota bacterium]